MLQYVLLYFFSFFFFFFLILCVAGSPCCSGCSLVAVSGAPAAVQGFSSRGPSRRRARAGGARFQELRLTGSGAQTQELRCTGLAPPRHVGSSWLRDRTRASCTDRQILFFFFNFFSFNLFFLLKDNCFTKCCFLSNLNINQP